MAPERSGPLRPILGNYLYEQSSRMVGLLLFDLEPVAKLG